MIKDSAYKYKKEKDIWADKIKEVIKDRGLSRSDIEKRTGFSKSSQREIESGSANTTKDTEYEYMEALEITQTDFYRDPRFDYLIITNKDDLKVIPSSDVEEK